MNQHEQLIKTLFEQLAALKRAMMRSRDQMLGELQLTRTQIEVLMLLIEKDAQTVGALADRLAVTHSAATQTIETLVKRDLVERTPDGADRRVVRTSLSLAGRKLADKLHTQRMERLSEIFADFGPEELTVITTVLERLSRLFDETKPTKEDGPNV